MKNKGFVLMETIVVIVVISVSLITIFFSYNKILRKVKSENKYDTSEYIYMTHFIRNNLKKHNIEADNISNNINDYSTSISDNTFNVEKIYILTNFSAFKDNRNKFDPYMIDYISRLDVEDSSNQLIIVEYKKLVRDKNYNLIPKYNETEEECNNDSTKCLYETSLCHFNN